MFFVGEDEWFQGEVKSVRKDAVKIQRLNVFFEVDESDCCCNLKDDKIRLVNSVTSPGISEGGGAENDSSSDDDMPFILQREQILARKKQKLQ